MAASDALTWFVYIGGETFGPVTTGTIQVMLHQGRLQFSDFIWKQGLTKWARISDLDQFATLLPAYPNVPIPGGSKQQHQQQQQHAAPTQTAPAQKASQKSEPEAGSQPVAATSKPVQPAPNPKIRRMQRVPMEGKVSIVDHHHSYEILDISEGGILLKAHKKIEVGTEVKLKLTTPSFEKPLEMTGMVIRHVDEKDAEGFAIQFTRVNPSHKRMILEYVTQALAQ